jgi:XTP/dITP diphosphohydrolase
MKLIYGTYNPSKVKSMIKKLEGLGIEIKGLECLNLDLLEAEESGKEPLDNAREKALTYYQQLRKPVFSCDSGLYFDDVAQEDQPGVFIKRINGNSLTYKEMLEYYSKLAAKYGGKLTAYYKNSICLVMDEKNIFEYDGEDIQSEKFYIVDKPHVNYQEGFPLDSLSVEMKSMRYYYDLAEEESENLNMMNGFRDFFRKSLFDWSIKSKLL